MDHASGTTSPPLDENPVVIPVVISLTVFVQLLLPFVFWSCSFCTRLYKECKDRPKYRTETQDIEEECEERLQIAASARNQEEFDQAVQEYRQAVEEYQGRTAMKDLKREQGFCSNAKSVRRLISLHMYFSFNFWLIYSDLLGWLRNNSLHHVRLCLLHFENLWLGDAWCLFCDRCGRKLLLPRAKIP